jgi:hypothetical protein
MWCHNACLSSQNQKNKSVHLIFSVFGPVDPIFPLSRRGSSRRDLHFLPTGRYLLAMKAPRLADST